MQNGIVFPIKKMHFEIFSNTLERNQFKNSEINFLKKRN